MQTSLLVTGANGFVGHAFCEAAKRHDLLVRAALRKGKQCPADIECVYIDDIDMTTNWSGLLTGIDVVVHLAARVHVMHENTSDPMAEFRRVNVGGTEHLARDAASNGVRRFVFVSSIKVNGEETTDGARYSEQSPALPHDFYGISKWEAEQALHRVARETGMEVVIVRPPLVYGPGVKGNFERMLSVVARGIPMPFASVSNLRSLIYVDNLAEALVTCAIHPAAAGQMYMVSDGEDISTPDLLRRLAVGIGVPSRLVACPPGLLSLAGRLIGKSGQLDRLLGSLRVDSGKIRSDLNWVPRYSLQQGLQATAEWYRKIILRLT